MNAVATQKRMAPSYHGADPGSRGSMPSMSDAAADPNRPTRWDGWDFAAAIILSLATVASAWSGYQATRWSGQKVKDNRASILAMIEADRAEDAHRSSERFVVATGVLWSLPYRLGY
jgi:hypothetical protein